MDPRSSIPNPRFRTLDPAFPLNPAGEQKMCFAKRFFFLFDFEAMKRSFYCDFLYSSYSKQLPTLYRLIRIHQMNHMKMRSPRFETAAISTRQKKLR